MESIPVLPPPVTLARMHGMGGDKADANANHSHLGGPQGAGIRATLGAHSLSLSENDTVKAKTQRKAL